MEANRYDSMRKEHKSIADAFRDLERMGYLIKSIGIHKEGYLKVICRPRKEDDGEEDAFQEALKQGYGIDESPPSFIDRK
jgi:hypothetical protein